jgi:hypothetical protein
MTITHRATYAISICLLRGVVLDLSMEERQHMLSVVITSVQPHASCTTLKIFRSPPMHRVPRTHYELFEWENSLHQPRNPHDNHNVDQDVVAPE